MELPRKLAFGTSLVLTLAMSNLAPLVQAQNTTTATANNIQTAAPTVALAVKEGFTAEEIEAAKKGYLQSRQVSRAQDNELVSRVANYLFFNRPLTFDEQLETRIAALTPELVNAAMRKYITPDKITIIKAGDFAKK